MRMHTKSEDREKEENRKQLGDGGRESGHSDGDRANERMPHECDQK